MTSALGTMIGTAIAEVLLLLACVWIAVRLARTSHGVWLGAAVATARTAAPSGVEHSHQLTT